MTPITNENAISLWNEDIVIQGKQKNFELIEAYLINRPPKRILEIGCGLARESEYFQKKYNSELYLLDGDYRNKPHATRKKDYGPAETMDFYVTEEDLKTSWNSRKMSYTFVNASNPVINNDTTFDVIYSFESCGFHYPVSTYKELIKKHSTPDSILIFDLRKTSLSDQSDIEVHKVIADHKKYITAEIKFKT